MNHEYKTAVNNYSARRGMTFVELLAVLVILGLVAGVFTVGIAGKFNESKRELTKSQIRDRSTAKCRHTLRRRVHGRRRTSV